MSFPHFYDPNKVGTLYRPDVTDAIIAGNQHNFASADEDTERTGLLLVDAQVDFVHEDGALSVPGAVDDTRRTIEWIFEHVETITHIYASLDSHLPTQIFSPAWWVDADGTHPEPFTIITHKTVREGEWRALYHADWASEYTRRLEENAKKQLMIWPYHTLIGTSGHTITPALYEAIAYHGAARHTQPTFITKGTVPQVEHYSLFEPEITPPEQNGSAVNHRLLDTLAQYDKIYMAGQAKSHCVLESVTSMMRYFADQPQVIRKIHVLTDAMSSVASPDVDFDQMANDTLQSYAEQGLNLTTTTA
ncbi:MAG: hypothetical protein ACFE0Q_19985 [Anaerolineae bacterium]